MKKINVYQIHEGDVNNVHVYNTKAGCQYNNSLINTTG